MLKERHLAHIIIRALYNSSIHPDYYQALHNLLSTNYEDLQASREKVECWRQDHSNFVAVSAPRPFKVKPL